MTILIWIENHVNPLHFKPGEFWLGLGKIHTLAAQGNTVLDIQLEDWKHSRHFVKYRFYLEGPESNYTIHLKYLSGDLPDLMGNHAGVTFSTRDRDKDGHRDSNCAHQQTGRGHVSNGYVRGGKIPVRHVLSFLLQVDGGSTSAETRTQTVGIST